MTMTMSRPEPVAHDETPSDITDHPFVPRNGVWWERCEICGLAQAAHLETTIDSFEEMKKEHIEKYGEVRYASDTIRDRHEELNRLSSGGRTRIGYPSDDFDEDD